jgi:hypothetical protein
MMLTDEQIVDAIKSVCDPTDPRFPGALIQFRAETIAMGRAVERALLSASKPAVAQGDAYRQALHEMQAEVSKNKDRRWLLRLIEERAQELLDASPAAPDHIGDAAEKVAAPAQSHDALTRELLDTLQMVVKHFTQTPSTLADSQARGKAHEVIAKAYAQIGYSAAPAQSAEPVAWLYESEDPLDGGEWLLTNTKPNRRNVKPLYAAPQPSQPAEGGLTELQCAAIDFAIGFMKCHAGCAKDVAVLKTIETGYPRTPREISALQSALAPGESVTYDDIWNRVSSVVEEAGDGKAELVEWLMSRITAAPQPSQPAEGGKACKPGGCAAIGCDGGYYCFDADGTPKAALSAVVLDDDLAERALQAAGQWANTDTPIAAALAYRDGYVAGAQSAGVLDDERAASEGAVIERLRCVLDLTREALAVIIADVEATYSAAEKGKPLEISIGQFRRLDKAKTRLTPNARAAFPQATATQPAQTERALTKEIIGAAWRNCGARSNSPPDWALQFAQNIFSAMTAAQTASGANHD